MCAGRQKPALAGWCTVAWLGPGVIVLGLLQTGGLLKFLKHAGFHLSLDKGRGPGGRTLSGGQAGPWKAPQPKEHLNSAFTGQRLGRFSPGLPQASFGTTYPMLQSKWDPPALRLMSELWAAPDEGFSLSQTPGPCSGTWGAAVHHQPKPQKDPSELLCSWKI